MHYELLIQNGLVFDGLGGSRLNDIAIHEGRIAALSSRLNVTADKIIDASGYWVTPGFIDIHTHYDLEVEIAPALSESVRHGVTSLIMGGCSLSTTFGEPDELAQIFSRVETLPPELIQGWLRGAQTWSSPKAYFDHLRTQALGPHVACMLGHSALRVKVMGLKKSLHEPATSDEIETMRHLAEEALDAGCIGISVDMVHWHKVSGLYAGRALPSHHASYQEYKMLADVCRKRDAVFQVTPNPQNVGSFWDILRLCIGLGRAPLRCTILSALDVDVAPSLWRIFPLLLFVANRIFGCNIRFQTLSEPFTIYADGHLTPFFEEFPEGVQLNNCKSLTERRALWQDLDFRKGFAGSWRSGFPRTFHRDLERMTILNAPDPSLSGKTIAQAAAQMGKEPMTCFMDLLEAYDEGLRWVACSANQRDTIRQKLMQHPHILPGFSDAGAHSRNIAFFDSALSVLRQSVQTGFLPPERAVERITREPARWFNLDTGYLAEGVKADIVILDPIKLSQPIPEPVALEDPVLNGAVRMVKRDPDPAVCHVFIQGKELVRHGEPLLNTQHGATGTVLCQYQPTRSEKEALARFRNRISENCCLPENTDYWTVFLRKHQHPANVALHCFALTLTYIIPLTALMSGNPLLLLLFPVAHLIGLVGHLCFERTPIDQQDLIFSWRAGVSLHWMFFSVLLGRYGKALRQAQQVEPVLC
jgi:N-acyl-D-aspartate/D-glutamate deacylase